MGKKKSKKKSNKTDKKSAKDEFKKIPALITCYSDGFNLRRHPGSVLIYDGRQGRPKQGWQDVEYTCGRHTFVSRFDAKTELEYV